MKVEWIKIEDGLPEDSEDGDEFYVLEFGNVRDDAEWTTWGIDWDTCDVDPKEFHVPNSDPEYGGRFGAKVTHWARKKLPEPPIL